MEDLIVPVQSCLETPDVLGSAPMGGFPSEELAPCKTIFGVSPHMMQLICSQDKALKNNQELIIL